MKRKPLLELERLIPNKRRHPIATNADQFCLKERSVTEVYSSSLPASSQPFRYPCFVCARTFHSPKALHGHMRSHPGRPISRVLPPKSTPLQKPPAYSNRQKLHRQLQSSTAIDIHGHDDGKFSAERSQDRRRVLVESSARSATSDSQKAGFGAGFVLDRIGKPSSTLEITASILTSALSCSSVDEEEPTQERDNFAAVCLVMLAAGKIGTADLGPNCSSNMDLFCRGRFNGTTNYCVVAHEKRDIKRDQAPQFQCRTCHKFFKSPQSLGGHRASHGTLSTASCYMARERAELLESVDRNELPGDEKGHKCSICHRTFLTGQALGGHKRHHIWTGADKSSNFGDSNDPPVMSSERMRALSSSEANAGAPPTGRERDYTIDLNLPVCMDDIYIG